jgi:hypothetical protein
MRLMRKNVLWAMNKLTNLPVKAETSSSSQKVPVVKVKNDIQRFNKAVKRFKDLEDMITKLGVVLKEAGIKVIISHNVEDPVQPWTSVKLEDKVQERVTVTFSTRYVNTTEEKANAAFENMKKLDGTPADVNNYVHETLTAKFDSEVFNVKTVVQDPETKLETETTTFSEERYNAFQEAIAIVAQRFGVESPLTTNRVVKPKPEFGEKRWRLFAVEDQLKLQALLPAVVSLTPNAS